jgi:hypothetical protein
MFDRPSLEQLINFGSNTNYKCGGSISRRHQYTCIPLRWTGCAPHVGRPQSIVLCRLERQFAVVNLCIGVCDNAQRANSVQLFGRGAIQFDRATGLHFHTGIAQGARGLASRTNPARLPHQSKVLRRRKPRRLRSAHPRPEPPRSVQHQSQRERLVLCCQREGSVGVRLFLGQLKVCHPGLQRLVNRRCDERPETLPAR